MGSWPNIGDILGVTPTLEGTPSPSGDILQGGPGPTLGTLLDNPCPIWDPGPWGWLFRRWFHPLCPFHGLGWPWWARPRCQPPQTARACPPQITESTIEITQSTKDIDTARSTVVDLRRSVQTLEIDLESLRNQVPPNPPKKSLASPRPPSPTGPPSRPWWPAEPWGDALQKGGLEANLLEVENRYAMQLEQLNGLILRAEAELVQVRNELQHQAEEYQALLNVKDKLETEIMTYRQLLEGGEEFR